MGPLPQLNDFNLELLVKNLFPDDSNAGKNFRYGYAHQDARNKVLHICSTGGLGYCTAGNAENDEDKAVKNALLTRQLLLREILRPPLLCDIAADGYLVHIEFLLVFWLSQAYRGRWEDDIPPW